MDIMTKTELFIRTQMVTALLELTPKLQHMISCITIRGYDMPNSGVFQVYAIPAWGTARRTDGR